MRLYHNLRCHVALGSHAAVSVSLPQHVPEDLLSKRYKHLFTMEPVYPRGPPRTGGGDGGGLRGPILSNIGPVKIHDVCLCVMMCVCLDMRLYMGFAWIWNFNQHLLIVIKGGFFFAGCGTRTALHPPRGEKQRARLACKSYDSVSHWFSFGCVHRRDHL